MPKDPGGAFHLRTSAWIRGEAADRLLSEMKRAVSAGRK